MHQTEGTWGLIPSTPAWLRYSKILHLDSQNRFSSLCPELDLRFVLSSLDVLKMGFYSEVGPSGDSVAYRVWKWYTCAR